MDSWLIDIAIVFLMIGFVFAFVEIVLNRSIYIKLVCLEALANVMISAICLWAAYKKHPAIIDTCIAISLILFLSTVACCYFIKTKGSANVASRS